MIFVTGGTGHTGSRAVRRLIERGLCLRCLLHTAGHQSRLPNGVEAVLGDASAAAALAEPMAGAEVCLHLAHIRFVPSVVEACRRAGVERLICLSSTRRFSRFETESSRAVVAGEAAVVNSGLRWTILRESMIYGGPNDNNMERLVRYFRRVPFFPLVRGGRQLVQPVFVWDVVGAIEAALQRAVSIGRAYTLAGPEPISYRHVVEAAARIAGRRPIFVPTPYPVLLAAAWTAQRLRPRSRFTVEQVQRLLEDKTFDISEARRDLDFDPIPFDEGMRRKRLGEV